MVQTSSNILRFETASNRNAFPGMVHYHDIWEMYYLTAGSCRYFIDKKTYRMNPGDLVLIPPGVIHRVIYDSPTHSRMLIYCSEDVMPASVVGFLHTIPWFSPAPHQSQQIESLFSKMRAEATSQDPFCQDSATALLAQLLILVVRTRSPIPQITVSSPFVEDAVLYIHENYSDRMTLMDAARHCAVSPEHLSRMFKRETGFGFNEYLNIYRLKKAESMIKSGQYHSISQISTLCGFADSNYFSKAYRKMHGITPSQAKQAYTQP